MKHRLFIIIAALAALGSMTTSCFRGDEFVAAFDGDHKTPISFNVNTSGGNVSASTKGYTTGSAATSVYTFETGDLVSIGIKGNGSTSRSTTEEVIKQYTVAAGTGTQALTYSKDADGSTTYAFDWMGTSETIKLRAWSYGTTTTPATDPVGATFTLATNQATAPTQELLYAKEASYPYSASAQNIILYHQLSRVVVNIKGTLGTATSGSTITITGVSIGDGNIPTSATFAAPTTTNYGTWSGHSGSGTITAKSETATSGYTATYSAVILPYTSPSTPPTQKFIVITTSNGTYAYSIAASTTFAPGRQYTFNITDLNQIDFNVTVSAWDGGGSEPAATNLTFSS